MCAPCCSDAASRTSRGVTISDVCGGCALQHLELATQVAVKQRVLEDTLWHIGKVRAATNTPAHTGPAWGYRHRARFTVRHVRKKGGVLVGFHEKAAVTWPTCELRSRAGPSFARCCVPLRRARRTACRSASAFRKSSSRWAKRRRRPGVAGSGCAVGADERCYGHSRETCASRSICSRRARHGAPARPAEPADLYYVLPEFDVRIHFEPTDFTQVNHAVNRVLVAARFDCSRHNQASASRTCSAVSAISRCR